MNNRNLSYYAAFVWGMILLFMIASPLPHAVASPFRSALPTIIEAVITDSGSTNTCPYTIDVWLNGTATYTVTVCHLNPLKGSGTLTPALTIQFFEHLIVAQPFSRFPPLQCVKPVSFRTTTIVQYGKSHILDISCPNTDRRITNLYTDSTQIQQALGFSPLRKV